MYGIYRSKKFGKTVLIKLQMPNVILTYENKL